jgi:hypothetical protein
MSDHLGIGLRGEVVPSGLELALQLHIILNDAVVDDDGVALGIAVWMGVFLGRTPMRGPARVANAVGAFHRVGAHGVFEVV